LVNLIENLLFRKKRTIMVRFLVGLRFNDKKIKTPQFLMEKRGGNNKAK